MATVNEMEIDSRVLIALDALTPLQRAPLEPLLRDKKAFLAHAARPGVSRKLSGAKPLNLMKVGNHGLRLIYSRHDDDIAILDLMHKATIEYFTTRKPGKTATPRADRRGKSSRTKKV